MNKFFKSLFLVLALTGAQQSEAVDREGMRVVATLGSYKLARATESNVPLFASEAIIAGILGAVTTHASVAEKIHDHRRHVDHEIGLEETILLNIQQLRKNLIREDENRSNEIMLKTYMPRVLKKFVPNLNDHGGIPTSIIEDCLVDKQKKAETDATSAKIARTIIDEDACKQRLQELRKEKNSIPAKFVRNTPIRWAKMSCLYFCGLVAAQVALDVMTTRENSWRNWLPAFRR